MPIDPSEYARRLYQRRGEAVEFTRGTITSESGWIPGQKDCHANVAMLTEMDSNYTPVHGWLVADYEIEFGFIAHSIVRDNNGRYICITPPAADLPYQYPFLIDEDENYWRAADFSKRLFPQMLKCPVPQE